MVERDPSIVLSAVRANEYDYNIQQIYIGPSLSLVEFNCTSNYASTDGFVTTVQWVMIGALARVLATLLAIAGVGSAFVSDWFIHALDPAIKQLGISEAFAGLVIVAIAGNAVENATGLVLAWKHQSDLAISVVRTRSLRSPRSCTPRSS